jgi:hypothetical protein
MRPPSSVEQITQGYREHKAEEAAETLTSTEVVHALVGAKAAGKLSVSGDSPVVITGPDQDGELARAVLRGRGLTLTRYPERDKWRRS